VRCVIAEQVFCALASVYAQYLFVGKVKITQRYLGGGVALVLVAHHLKGRLLALKNRM
jgi:uncharacterized MnhB-related membrane protein